MKRWTQKGENIFPISLAVKREGKIRQEAEGSECLGLLCMCVSKIRETQASLLKGRSQSREGGEGRAVEQDASCGRG